MVWRPKPATEDFENIRMVVMDGRLSKLVQIQADKINSLEEELELANHTIDELKARG